MRKTGALLLSLALAACGGSQGSLEQRSRDALPSKDSVAVGDPRAAATALRERGGQFTSDQQDSKVGDASSYYAMTVSLAVSVNGAVIWTLGTIETIANLPPTACTTDTCTWGPGSGALDPVDWKLEVKYDAASDSFTYALSGKAKAGGDGQFHAVVSGTSKPSALPHRGTGSFTVDFDQGRVLNPGSTDQGRLSVNYSNVVPGKGHIDATFLGVKDDDHPGQKLNAAYGYDEDPSGGGALEIAFRNLTSLDTYAFRSRWKGTGAGRADAAVHLNGGGGSFYDAQVSECWGTPPFHVVWFHTNDPAHLGPDSGSVSDCAYADTSFASKQAP